MKLYFISADFDGASHYATLDEAKKAAREAAANSYFDVAVDQVDVETTKENILRLVNNSGGTQTITREAVYTAKARKKA